MGLSHLPKRGVGSEFGPWMSDFSLKQAPLPHAAQIQCYAHKLELGFCLLEQPHAELPGPQNFLDPTIGWLGKPFAFALIRFALVSLELGNHRHRVQVALR